jgi:beta-lactam-binding protein with PASTA domain
MAPKDSTVAVVVSAGPNTFPVPNVIGKSESEARDLLKNSPGKFLVTSKSDTVDNEAPAGTVVGISPDPSGQYPPGTKFTLTLSSGSVKVDVPDVTTQIQDDATKTLKDLGLNVGYKQDSSDPNAVEGTVIKQSVKPGTKVAKGTTVTLTIAVKPSQPTPTPTPTDTPTDPNSPPITIGGGAPNGNNGGNG